MPLARGWFTALATDSANLYGNSIDQPTGQGGIKRMDNERDRDPFKRMDNERDSESR